MKVAGIDCGTNSIRLLIASVEPGKPLADIVRTMEVVRLGQGVDTRGEFAQEALDRTFAAAERYAQLCQEHEVEAIRFVATSATRDARNREEFISGIHERLGVVPEVVSGEREAQLSFQGAASVLDSNEAVAVVDLGGGSTEIVLGSKEQRVIGAHSMNVGCVRMFERHFRNDPPTEIEIEAARADVRMTLDEAGKTVDFTKATRLIGLAGTVTTVTARALGLPAYDSKQIDAATLSVEQVHEACEWLLSATNEEREAEGYLHPGRVDVIGAGALVWSEVVSRFERDSGLTEVTTSEHDILDGIALWAAGEID